jgi:hypothetical protein
LHVVIHLLCTRCSAGPWDTVANCKREGVCAWGKLIVHWGRQTEITVKTTALKCCEGKAHGTTRVKNHEFDLVRVQERWAPKTKWEPKHRNKEGKSKPGGRGSHL